MKLIKYLIVALCCCVLSGHAQPVWTYDISGQLNNQISSQNALYIAYYAAVSDTEFYYYQMTIPGLSASSTASLDLGHFAWTDPNNPVDDDEVYNDVPLSVQNNIFSISPSDSGGVFEPLFKLVQSGLPVSLSVFTDNGPSGDYISDVPDMGGNFTFTFDLSLDGDGNYLNLLGVVAPTVNNGLAPTGFSLSSLYDGSVPVAIDALIVAAIICSVVFGFLWVKRLLRTMA
jgi:hypothetical protein